MEVSDSFIKKLISLLGVRFLASVFHDEENGEEIYRIFYKNMPLFKKRSFVKYWHLKEKIFDNDEAKECVVSLIKNEALIENAKD